MGKPLRVLIVEDSEEDARLLLRELGRGGTGPHWSTTAFQRSPDILAFEVRLRPQSRPFAAPLLTTGPVP